MEEMIRMPPEDDIEPLRNDPLVKILSSLLGRLTGPADIPEMAPGTFVGEWPYEPLEQPKPVGETEPTFSKEAEDYMRAWEGPPSTPAAPTAGSDLELTEALSRKKPTQTTPKPSKPAPKKEAKPATVTPETIMPTKLSDELAPPGVPEFRQTPQYDYAGELTKIVSSIPRTVEELAGPRPTGPKRSWLESALLGGARGVTGLSPLVEEEKAQQIRDRQYAENVNWAKERLNKIQDTQFKIAEHKFRETEAKREREKQQYAELGKANPLLAKNPKYVAGLYPDLPPDMREQMIRDSIDPNTGQFKPNSPLYLDPDLQFKLKLKYTANIMALAGETDPKAAVFLALDPAAGVKYITDAKERAQLRMKELATGVQTPENKAEYAKLEKFLWDISTKERNLTDMQKYMQKKEQIEREHKQAVAEAHKIYKGKPQALAAELELINKTYNDLAYMAKLNSFGSTADAYVRALYGSQTKKEPAEYANNPLYIAGSAVDPTMTPGLGKADADTYFREFANTKSMADQLQASGKNVAAVMTSDKVPPTTRNLYIRSIGTFREKIAGAGYKDALGAAEKVFKGKANIPFSNLMMAYVLIAQSGGKADPNQVREVLIANAPVNKE